MGLLKSKDARHDALIIKNNLSDFEYAEGLIRTGTGLFDSMSSKFYAIDNSKPVRYFHGRKSSQAYIIDGDKGVTCTLQAAKDGLQQHTEYADVQFQRHFTLLELKTNPDIVGAAIDAEIISKGFKIKADMRTVFYGFIAGAVLFGLAALMI